jgi:peptide/nickel transport system permease protein
VTGPRPDPAAAPDASVVPAADAGIVAAERRRVVRRLVLSPSFLTLGAIVALAVLAPFIAPYDPVESRPQDKLLPPSATYLMGTDPFGFDILSRVLYATRTNLPIAVGSVLVAVLIGWPLGAAAGYVGGRFDGLMMRLTEVGQAFPQILFAMAIFAAFGNSAVTLVGVLVALNVPVYVRMVRSVMLPLREADFILAARVAGNPTHRVVLRHALPNTLVPVFSQFSLSAAYAVQLIAGLSFIGLGIRIPEPEWGSMINIGVDQMIFGRWWVSFFPGMAVVITSFALMGVSNQLRSITLRDS